MATIEFFYDYASPFSYFADKQIREVAKRTGSELIYKPAVLGVLIVESNNTPPPAVPAKGSYYQVDMRRWSKRLDMPFKINPAFPVRSINLMRAALIAQDLDCFEAHPETANEPVFEVAVGAGELVEGRPRLEHDQGWRHGWSAPGYTCL